MCYRKIWFYTYQYMQLNPIYLADETTHSPQGKGLVNLSLPRTCKIFLSNVWYVPIFQMSLFPLVLIRWGGHQIIMQNGFVKINLVTTNLDEKILRIQGTIISRNKNVVEMKILFPFTLQLWNFQVGHLIF